MLCAIQSNLDTEYSVELTEKQNNIRILIMTPVAPGQALIWWALLLPMHVQICTMI